jgi:exo-beta-1,3-glucanase (GH17 family)
MQLELIIVIAVAIGISIALLIWMARSFNSEMEAVAAHNRALHAQEADVTFNTAGNDTVFSSNSVAGHKFLDGDRLAVPNADATAFVARARSEGLVVKESP